MMFVCKDCGSVGNDEPGAPSCACTYKAFAAEMLKLEYVPIFKDFDGGTGHNPPRVRLDSVEYGPGWKVQNVPVPVSYGEFLRHNINCEYFRGQLDTFVPWYYVVVFGPKSMRTMIEDYSRHQSSYAGMTLVELLAKMFSKNV